MVPEQLKATMISLVLDADTAEQIDTTFGKPFFSIPVKPELSTNIWNAFRQVCKTTGYWPIFVTGEVSLKNLIAQFTDEDRLKPAEIIDIANKTNFREWLKQEEEASKEFGDFRTERMGPWPEDAEPSHTLTQLLELGINDSGEISLTPLEEIILLLCPTTEPWQIPALLNIGGWNSSPDAAIHTAAFKYWQDRYEAEPCFIDIDTIEFFLTNPPTTQEEALELAVQQYLYCNDRIDQGYETLPALAGSLMDSTVWYFWWD